MRKYLFIFLLYFSSLNISYSIEADVFVQSTVNRASSILSDNSSKDQKIAELKKIAKLNNKIKYYKNSKNLGKHLSLIKALEKSNSRYIMILDSDDFIIPNAIEKLLNYTQRNNLDLKFH